MTQEALKLALEALKTIDEAMPFPVAKLAQAAIKEALAQPQQEPRNIRERWNIEIDGDDLLVCFNDHEKSEGCHYERYVPATTTPPQRTEPVAYTGNGTAGREADVRPTGFFFQMPKPEQEQEEYLSKAYRLANELRCHLAIAPAPQRAWVGLKDEEANELWESTDSNWELMKRTEAKLKEKNGYAEENT